MRLTRCSFSLAVLVLLAGAPSTAKLVEPQTGHPWCGTTPSRLPVELAKDKDHQRRLARDRQEGKVLHSEPAAVKVGDVAVIVDDGSIVVHASQLDLEELGVQYDPQKKGGFRASASGAPVSDERGDKLDLDDDDSEEVQFPAGFKFRFFGKAYQSMFVHSDGNITFVEPDASSFARDLARVISGPPRIAPLFNDLNPATATGEGGVYVLASKTKVVVTWFDLPEFGRNNHNTFQVVLFPSKGKVDGKIVFALGQLDASEAVVGIAPGNNSDVQLVDYTGDLPTGVIKKGIVERFSMSEDLDHLAIARAFLREFADDYDHLVVWLDFPASLGGRTFAFELNLKNEIRGIGLPVFDISQQAGSKGRLRSYLQMGALSRYPSDPNTTFLGTNSTLDVLGQEGGHRWLAFVSFIDDNGQVNDALLGRDLAHWSFCHNSLASDVEGNEFREDGGGRFTSIAATMRYSPLDQYIMGLIPASDVPLFYYVDPCANRAAAPEVGGGAQGQRMDVSVQQVIAAEGARVPAADKAPHDFKMAFILVAPAGTEPNPAAIEKVDRIRAAWEPYFAQATDGNGSVSTALKLKRRR